MPMKGAIKFVPNTSTSGASLVPIDDIPTDVITDIEAIYDNLKVADGRFRAEFDNEVEALQFVRYATSYCAQRPAGAIRFRRSPTKGLQKNVIEFRVTDLKIAEDNAPEPTVEAPAETKRGGRK